MTTTALMDAQALAGISERLEEHVQAGHVPGVLTVIWQGGEIQQVAAVGLADVARRTPVRRDTIFQVASMTKPMVTVAALQLVEEGKLALDDPITTWIPELAAMSVLVDPTGPLDSTYPAPRDITVRDLLTQRSGIPYAFTAVGPIAEEFDRVLASPLDTTLTPDEWLAALGRLPLRYAPGERWEYGHSTEVLGFLIARIEGMTIGEVLQKRLFEPLGMKDTAFYVRPDDLPRLAKTYTKTEDGFLDLTPTVKTAPPTFEAAGGGLYSTADDYLTFARVLLGRGSVDGVKILLPESVDLMETDQLTPEQHTLPALGLPGFFAAQGFGLGLCIIQKPEELGYYGAGATGAYGWPGVYGTWWQVDRENDLIALFFIQDFVPLTAGGLANAPAETPASRLVHPEFLRQLYEAVKQ